MTNIRLVLIASIFIPLLLVFFGFKWLPIISELMRRLRSMVEMTMLTTIVMRTVEEE